MLKEYIQRPLAFSLVILALTITGILCIFDLPIKMYPDMVKPSFRIYYGHQDIGLPHELKKTYGRDIEEQIKQLQDLESYDITYYYNQGRISLNFKWDVEEEEIKEKLQNLFNTFKAQGGNKFWFDVQSENSRSSGNMIITISHKQMSSSQLQDFLENNLEGKIKKIDNVDQIQFWGWFPKRLVVELDRNKLLTHKVHVSQIMEAIERKTKATMAGKITSGAIEGQIQLTFPAQAKDSSELLNIIISQDPQTKRTLRLKELGTITEIEEKRDSIYALNGVDSNFLSVVLKPEGDVKKTCDEVKVTLEKFKQENPGVDFTIIVNPSIFIENAINNLLINALIGGVVATLIILVFLGNISNTIIIGISIPFCIITSFILMKLFNVTINIISLGGMAIGIGMILDSSIVSLENIYRKIKDTGDSITDRAKLILDATKEVFLPIICSMLTSIVVFLPIMFTSSYTKSILGDLAKTVVFTLIVSIIAALFIVPVASFRFCTTGSSPFMTKIDPIPWLGKVYNKILSFFIRSKFHSLTSIIVCAVLFLASLFLIPKIRKEIVAVPGTKLFAINVEMPDNQDLELTKSVITDIRKFLKSRKEVKLFTTVMWNPSSGWHIAELESRKQFEDLKKDFEKAFGPEPDRRLDVIKWDPGRLPLPRQNDLVINFSGSTEDEVKNFTDLLMSKGAEFKASMWRAPWISKREAIAINFHPWTDEQATKLLHPYVQASTVSGIYVTDIPDEGKTRSLNLIFKDNQKVDYLDDLKNQPILYKNKIVPFKAIADIDMLQESYIPLFYEDGVQMQKIFINFKSEDDSEKEKLKEEVKKSIKGMHIPVDMSIDYPDTNKEINKSYESFLYSLLISIGLVFLIIALLFNSLMYPLIILLTVPFAVTGVVAGLFVAKSTLSLNSMLGTILLSGLVVNNAILFIDFYLGEKNKGKSTKESIQNAAQLRFRPILMTTLTTLLGVIPIALAIGESGEILQPLGVSVFFGLLVSTILTLFIIPSFLNLFNKNE